MGESPVNEDSCLGPSESKGESLLPYERITGSIKLWCRAAWKWEQETKLGPPEYHPPWTGLTHSELIDGGFLINTLAGKLGSDIMTLPHKSAMVSSSVQTVTPPFLGGRAPWHHQFHIRVTGNQQGATAWAYVVIREISNTQCKYPATEQRNRNQYPFNRIK